MSDIGPGAVEPTGNPPLVVRFNDAGVDGLADLGGQGRKRRLTEEERFRLIGLVNQPPPGRPVRDETGELSATEETGPPKWTLDALATAAQAEGIEVHRSQVREDPARRRDPVATHPVLDHQQGPRLRGKRTRIVTLYTHPRPGRLSCA